MSLRQHQPARRSGNPSKQTAEFDGSYHQPVDFLTRVLVFIIVDASAVALIHADTCRLVEVIEKRSVQPVTAAAEGFGRHGKKDVWNAELGVVLAITAHLCRVKHRTFCSDGQNLVHL